MITNERVEIIKHILDKKAISINVITTIFNVNNLKELTKGQAIALEQLLAIIWKNIIQENIKSHQGKVLLSL